MDGDVEGPPAQPEGPGEARRFGGPGREFGAYFEFLALTTVSVAVPLFDTLQRNVNAVFTSRHLARTSVWIVTLVIALGPAVALWAVEVVVGLIVPRWRRFAHAILVGGMA